MSASDCHLTRSAPGQGPYLWFPDQVDSNAARLVAAGVIAIAGAVIVTGWWWLSALLIWGFAARATSGPRFSPLARTALWVSARVFDPVREPGAPKQFAQTIGLIFSVAAAISAGVGAHGAGVAILGGLMVAASLEAVFGWCAGCFVWAKLHGEVCVSCDDLTARGIHAH